MGLRRYLLGSCAALVATGLADGAFAQAVSATGDTSGAIAEVVVTANKREENLQRVAATVTAVNEATLQRQGVKEIFDLNKVVPEVVVGGGQLTQLTIRGIRTGATGPTTDSPNAVHVDGAYVSRFTSLQGLFFDVQRIEVLAGPQGTLYGRNSAGGTMNIITNKPTQHFGGQGSIDYGSYNAITANVALNIPLTSTLAVRGAYFRNTRHGYIDNGTDDADQEGLRFSALWKPTPADSLLLTADHQNVGGRLPGPSAFITEVLKQPSILTAANGSVSLVAAGTPGSVVVPIKTASDRYHLSQIYGNQDLSRQHTWGGGVMGQYDHDFGWANLTAQVSFRDSYSRNANGTLTGFPQDPRLVTAAVIRPGSPTLLVANAKWNSQEVRLTSPSNQALTWVAGVYRFHENSYDDHNITYNVSFPNTGAATVGQVIIPTPMTVNRDTINATGFDDAYAGFGQATYTVGGLHVTGGIRYNYEKKSATGSSINAGQVLIIPQLNGPPIDSRFNLKNSWDAVTYKINVAYDITPRNMVYFDHSTGFKSGGFGFGANPAYDPETIKSYEVGTKNRFLDNRLQVNASAWHYDYKNFVSNVPDFVVDSTTGRFTQLLNTSNAAAAKVDGQTLSLDWLVTPDDILNVNGTHLNARYVSFDTSRRYQFVLANPGPGLFGATAAVFNYSGAPIGNVPNWAVNATYDHIIHALGGRLDGQAALHYTGKRLISGNNASPANVNNYFFGSPYATVDLSLRYEPGEGSWSITGYVRNVGDKNIITGAGYSANEPYLPVSDPRVTYAYRTVTYGAAPRTVGVIVSASF